MHLHFSESMCIGTCIPLNLWTITKNKKKKSIPCRLFAKFAISKVLLVEVKSCGCLVSQFL